MNEQKNKIDWDKLDDQEIHRQDPTELPKLATINDLEKSYRDADSLFSSGRQICEHLLKTFHIYLK